MLSVLTGMANHFSQRRQTAIVMNLQSVWHGRLISGLATSASCCCRKHEEGGVIEEIEVVVLRFRTELRAPGCMHIVLECVSPRAPYLLENRSEHSLRYRQAGIADLPYLPLPAYSAVGFAWQKDAKGVPFAASGLSSVEQIGVEAEDAG